MLLELSQNVDHPSSLELVYNVTTSFKISADFSYFRWWKGPWQKCSKTCGKGISIRSVLCVRSSGNDEQVALKDEACAVIREKPPVLKSCVKETCPLAWTVGNWSKVKEVNTD